MCRFVWILSYTMLYSEYPNRTLYFRWCIFDKLKQLTHNDKTHNSSTCGGMQTENWDLTNGKAPQDRALWLFNPNTLKCHLLRCEPPTDLTPTDPTVITSAEFLSTPNICKATITSNSKFSYVYSKLEMNELSFLPNCCCPVTPLAIKSVTPRSSSLNFVHLSVWISNST